MDRYFPRKGDVIAVSFDPQAGHEQRGRRPALVVSNDLFNERTGFCLTCPVTSTDRGYPFHVKLPSGLDVDGVILVDQVKSLDFKARGAKPIGVVPAAILDEVLEILHAVIF